VVQVAGASGCSSCHGDATSPAPPTDLTGHTLTTALGVGAHRAHLDVPSRLRGPIGCPACHLVPGQVGDAGHIDSPPPAEVNTVLSWDRDTATCLSAACHGAARPVWTASGGTQCGSCHGIPPTNASHNATMTLTTCVNCHAPSVDATGAIILTPGPGGPTSKHMNGAVDVL
jgi:predicted CxxxxCH...CXXCH cytochrome family protein